MVCEVGAHAVAGSVEATHHGAGGDAERGSGLVVREPVHVDEADHLEMTWREAPERIGDPSCRRPGSCDILGAR